MKRFVTGQSRDQATLFPERLDDFIDEDNPVRVVDAFVDKLDLRELGFDGVDPAKTGRPGYHPASLLKLYIYGYLNRIQSSRFEFVGLEVLVSEEEARPVLMRVSWGVQDLTKSDSGFGIFVEFEKTLHFLGASHVA